MEPIWNAYGMHMGKIIQAPEKLTVAADRG